MTSENFKDFFSAKKIEYFCLLLNMGKIMKEMAFKKIDLTDIQER